MHPRRTLAKRLPPLHPGEVLREEFARAVGVPRTRIERLANEQTAVTADTALRQARYFGTTPSFWMGMKAKWDLERAQDEMGAELPQDHVRARCEVGSPTDLRTEAWRQIATLPAL